jgi:hypothetical protein
MTVSTNDYRIDYAGNGTTVAFAVPFRFLEDSHLRVSRTIVATGVETVLTLGSSGVDGYSITGAGTPNGGVVTVVTSPTASPAQRLSILLDPPFTQLIDYIANDPFAAETHERGLDKLTMLAKVLKGYFDWSIRIARNITGVSTELPTPVANGIWGWNATATAPKYFTSADFIVLDPDEISYLPPGAGAIPRTLSEELGDLWMSVKRFGAQGDGATDDTNAINNCIAAVAAAGGGVVYFPPGTYLVKFQGLALLGADKEIAITVQANNIHLVGAGRGCVQIKQMDGAIRAHVVKFGTRVGTPVLVSNCSIRGVTIDGNNLNITSPNPSPDEKNGDCINVSSSAERIIITDVNCKMAGHYGIGMQRAAFKDCLIEDVVITDTNGDGIDWKIDINAAARNNKVVNVTVLRHGLNTALSPQAGLDVRNGVSVYGCYVGEYAGDEAGLRVQIGADAGEPAAIPVQRSVINDITCIASSVGSANIGIQFSCNGVKADNLHAANNKWNYRFRSAYCEVGSLSSNAGETGVHIFGDANGTPDRNLIVNAIIRNATAKGLHMAQSGGFPPTKNSIVNLISTGNNSDANNVDIDATIADTRLTGGSVAAGYTDAGTDTFVLNVAGLVLPFRAGRQPTQYVEITGSASGNDIKGVSVNGTPKDLRIINDANGSDIFLDPQGAATYVKFGVKTGTGDVACDGYVSIKTAAGVVIKLMTTA